MEKTLTIDGKQIPFKSTGATALRYKAQFRKDLLAEIMKLGFLEKLSNLEELDPSDLEGADFEVIYNFIWVLAKTADPTISDPITWLDGFDEFPILEILPEVQDLLMSTIQGKKK
jgi:hypothetical protein